MVPPDILCNHNLLSFLAYNITKNTAAIGVSIKLDFGFLKGNKSTVTITTINIKLHGFMHSINGIVVKEKTFPLEIPFRNKTHTDMLTEATSFKAEKAEPIKVKGLDVADPFKLVSIEPALPLDIKADEKVVFKLVIAAPEHNYTGPMNIVFNSDTKEMVHIEITKSILEAKGQKIPIDTSSRILNLPKGQIFTEKIQLYKGFSYGDTVSRIEIETPFTFVSSDPKLPLKIDDTNTYILNLYIQAPATSYAGALQIKID